MAAIRQRKKQSNYTLPEHLDLLVRAKAVERRVRVSSMASEIIATYFGVPVEQGTEGPPHKA